MDIASQLRELARNLWWTWDQDSIRIFRELDLKTWREVNHNPVEFLSRISPERLEARAVELAAEARINYAFHRQNEYLRSGRTWGDIHAGALRAAPVAYFSAEFGLHESLPIYSGGLGVLAGDHMKSCSDLGVPLVGVGLFYAQGYFNQHLDADGWQEEHYRETNIDLLPMERAVDADGNPMRFRVDTRAGSIWVKLWQAWVGKSRLLLLDSDVEENTPENRRLTGRLYGGDVGTRIRQELILGVGGMRALAALNLRPGVLHLNEGHSAFCILEAVRQEMTSDKVPFDEAFRRVKARTLFTTHTPVPEGHDRFGADEVEETLGPLREDLGLSHDTFMALGRTDPGDAREPFCMTVLGLKGARKSNAVSLLHGRVTRKMWQVLWPDRPESEVPIGHITNGVHITSWLAPAMRQLCDRYLGQHWQHRARFHETWTKVDEINDEELWQAHQTLKARLVAYAQRQVCDQEANRQGSENGVCDITRQRLDANVLTLGFARRFATYKRGDLIFSDDKRLERMILDPKTPVQIVYAGKAHPQNEPGKTLIQRIFAMSRDPRFLGRIVFIEDYDINVSRHLVQGVDVWLNVPRRPKEASGTSGMKALFNGVLNLSVLDGWWAEAYDGQNGFAVGAGTEHAEPAHQDRRDATALYNVLENEVIPLYYERDRHGVPHAWVRRMKNAIRDLAWRFNADRMAIDYASRFYLPTTSQLAEL